MPETGAPLRVLLIEDDPDDAALVERQLRTSGLDIAARRAASAAEARAALQDQAWDVILADFTLPGFRGVDVLPMLEEYGLDAAFVIVSGTIDVATALEAMKAGAKDFILKDELERLPAVIERELASTAMRNERRRAEIERDEALVELKRANDELRDLAIETARRYEAEHQVAEVLQEALLALPKTVPGIAFAARYVSAGEGSRVGGDFYDLFEVRPGCVGILIGDVSGHGLEAATLTAVVRNSIRMRALDNLSPGETMAKTSASFFALTSAETFVTVFFGVLDTRTGVLRYTSAGHPAPVIMRADGRSEALPALSPIAGAFPAVEFHERDVRLDEGDQVFLYTDGLTEARGCEGMYGQDRLTALLAGLGAGCDPEDVADAAFADVMAYAGGGLRDDLALLVVKRSA